jgi:hypothetical protein
VTHSQYNGSAARPRQVCIDRYPEFRYLIGCTFPTLIYLMHGKEWFVLHPSPDFRTTGVGPLFESAGTREPMSFWLTTPETDLSFWNGSFNTLKLVGASTPTCLLSRSELKAVHEQSFARHQRTTTIGCDTLCVERRNTIHFPTVVFRVIKFEAGKERV